MCGVGGAPKGCLGGATGNSLITAAQCNDEQAMLLGPAVMELPSLYLKCWPSRAVPSEALRIWPKDYNLWETCILTVALNLLPQIVF